jgi:hypothetical protein
MSPCQTNSYHQVFAALSMPRRNNEQQQPQQERYHFPSSLQGTLRLQRPRASSTQSEEIIQILDEVLDMLNETDDHGTSPDEDYSLGLAAAAQRSQQ